MVGHYGKNSLQLELFFTLLRELDTRILKTVADAQRRGYMNSYSKSSYNTAKETVLALFTKLDPSRELSQRAAQAVDLALQDRLATLPESSATQLQTAARVTAFALILREELGPAHFNTLTQPFTSVGVDFTKLEEEATTSVGAQYLLLLTEEELFAVQAALATFRVQELTQRPTSRLPRLLARILDRTPKTSLNLNNFIS